MEGAWGVVDLPCGLTVERLEVHTAARTSRLLGGDYHAVSPAHRLPYWYRFDDPELHVTV